MGFFDKLKKITTNLFGGFTEADEAFFEELEETLILADLGMDTALEAVEQLRGRSFRRKAETELSGLCDDDMQEQGVSKILTINLNDMAKELKIK